jgi:site-specific recombinase XerD
MTTSSPSDTATTTALATLAGHPHPFALAELRPLVEKARDFARGARAASTLRAYRGDVERFAAWCAASGLDSLPALPGTVAMYLAALVDEGMKVATIDRALVAIAQAHRAAGFPSPRESELVRLTRRGIARKLGTAPARKAAFPVDALRAFARACDGSLAGLRDRALVLVGFAGAFRRSELVGLDVRDVAFGADGATVTLRHSKTDQEGAGVDVGIPNGSDASTCPVRALRAWLDAAKVTAGPIFRGVDRHGHVSRSGLSDRSVALVVKRACESTGLDASTFAGHSLRAGLATAAIRAGKSEASTMRQTRHRSVAVFRGYVRAASVFTDNAAGGLL